MHKDVRERTSAVRKEQIERHNEKTNVRSVNFSIGDFVLARNGQSTSHKLATKWYGPLRVIESKSNLVYVVEDIVKKKLETIHASRMILYKENLDGADVDQRLLRTPEHYATTYQEIHELMDI